MFFPRFSLRLTRACAAGRGFDDENSDPDASLPSLRRFVPMVSALLLLNRLVCTYCEYGLIKLSITAGMDHLSSGML